MKIKWQWFLGGYIIMFWIATLLAIIFAFTYTITFIIDPTTSVYMDIQNIDNTSIKELSEKYIKNLEIVINKPICYRFVKYQHEEHFKNNDSKDILLGTFHEWNNCYFIDISVNLYKMDMLNNVVRHETRHLIVQELQNENIIDLSKYTEEIAQEDNEIYNKLFDYGVELLKEKQGYGE